MSEGVVERVLRIAGAAVLLGFMGLALSSVAVPDADRVEAGGTIAAYGGGRVILSGEGGERYDVRVSPATVVRDGTAPASLSALRPGRLAVVFGATGHVGRTLEATTIMVFGGQPDRAGAPKMPAR